MAAPMAFATSWWSGRTHLADPGQPVGHQRAAAADHHQRGVAAGGLDAVDGVGQHLVGAAHRPLQLAAAGAGRAGVAELQPAAGDGGVGQRGASSRRTPAPRSRSR